MTDDGLSSEQIIQRLTQCLYQSKRPLALLLGAGCPASILIAQPDGSCAPLIPDISGLTTHINRALEKSSTHYKSLIKRLEHDIGASPNIEDVLSHIRGLAAIVGKHKIHDMDANAISELEDAVTDQITRAVEVPLPSERTPYDRLASWSRAVTTITPLKIFTTNYDSLLEIAFERNSVPFFDGFIGAREAFLDIDAIESEELPVRWVKILKLHGSSNWTLLPDNRVVRRQTGAIEGRKLIHPSHMKYAESRRMPYLIMQDQLRAFFRSGSATLITVGYSFSDEHINDLFAQGLRSNPNAKVFGLLYNDLAKYDRACSLANACPGLGLIAKDGAIEAGCRTNWGTSDEETLVVPHVGDFRDFCSHLESLVGTPSSQAESDHGDLEKPDAERP